ncbi:MAG: YidC/Oxa1 family membrane protein insertase [Oscillospiraceae bacterium]|nr:YidC/Oxa1 family membrane protein insertase [Oscillospiraceae bacterium]
MFNLIAIPLGWIMRLIYSVVKSYGMSILIFTLLVKACTIPSTYKQQVAAARRGLLSPKLAKIRKSYANNPQKMQEEQQKLYTQEGINMSQGCLGSILTLVVLMGVFQVVIRPLTYILQLKDDIAPATELLKTWLDSKNITEQYLTARPELIIIKYAKSNPEIFSTMPEFVKKVAGFQNTFLGFDLGGQPTLKPEGGWTIGAILLASLPILCFIAQIAMTIVSQRHMKKQDPESAQTMGSMNLMLYLMPLMSIWIGFKAPAGLNFYWLLNSVSSLLLTLGIYKYLNPERVLVINEKEKEKQLAKGPGWMQRMMDMSAEMQNEQQNGGMSIKGNRTRYSEGDDGMSRKERAEYDRKLIEAARRRAALKYGDELPDDSETYEPDELD